MTARRRMLWLAVGSGCAVGVFWSPFNLAPLMPLAFAVAMHGLRRVESGRQAVAFGALFGASYLATEGHFLLVLMAYSPLGAAFYPIAIAYAVPFGIAAAWGAWRLDTRHGVPRSVGFGLLYVVLEWLRTLGDLSFPADLMANAFGAETGWLSWSPWVGPFAITLVIMVVAALLDLAWENRARGRKALPIALAAVTLWFAPVVTDLVSRTEYADPTSLRVGIVQPYIRVGEKLDRNRHPELWRRLGALTRQAAVDADLVLWPESARPFPVVWDGSAPFRDSEVEDIARSVGVPILYGTEIAQVGDGQLEHLYNGAAIAYPDGRPGDWYGKQRLLPLAEGIPFRGLFGGSGGAQSGKRRSLLTLMGRFSPGPRPTVFEVGAARIGVLICYESMYPNLAAAYRREGANTLAVLTNDAWWGGSTFGPWHAEVVGARAKETGLPVLRAANSGISSVTDSRGRTVEATGLLEAATMTAEFTPATVRQASAVARGEWIPPAIAAVLVGITLRVVFARRKAVRGPRSTP